MYEASPARYRNVASACPTADAVPAYFPDVPSAVCPVLPARPRVDGGTDAPAQATLPPASAGSEPVLVVPTSSIPTGHKKVFPIPGGHKKSVLFQGRFSAVWTGLEPATPCVTGRYSNQLNYHTVLFADANIGIFPGTANIRAIISQLFSHFLPGRPGQNNRCGLSPPFSMNRFPNTRPRRPLLRRPGSTTPPARHSRQANTKKASFFKDAFLRYGRDSNPRPPA